MLILVGCSNKEVINHNYIFTGENDLWTAECKVNGTEIFIKKDGKTERYCNATRTVSVTYKKRSFRFAFSETLKDFL